MIKCFWLEPLPKVRLYLRVYGTGPCTTGPQSYHNAMTFLQEATREKVPTNDPTYRDWVYQDGGPQTPDQVDPSAVWPTTCTTCGAEIVGGTRQVFSDHVYRRVDTGEERGLRDWDHVPGAMWNAEWMTQLKSYGGEDGRVIHVVCPDGRLWCIDGPCSNCTRKGEDHRCWCRHGEPPTLTVDKNCNTCSAGAGSIDTGTFHGFLRNGEFVGC